jgi:hypothetical protein
MIMCHMIADDLDELHRMASAIGMSREWFQPLSFPHYDVSLTRRARALKLGAVEVDRRQLVRVIREIRMKRDMELIRQMLLAAEAHPDAHLYSFPPEVQADAPAIQVHARMLVDAGFLVQEKTAAGGRYGWRMTWAGHEFVDEIRDPEIWRKTKEGAEQVGSWSIKLLGELAAGFVRMKAADLGLPIG